MTPVRLIVPALLVAVGLVSHQDARATSSSTFGLAPGPDLRWSPDGKYLLTLGGVLARNPNAVLPTGFPPARAAREPNDMWMRFSGADWASDGTSIVTGSLAKLPEIQPQHLFLYGFKSQGQITPRRLVDGGKVKFGCVAPAWEPHGRRIAYTHSPFRSATSLRLIDADGTNAKTLIPSNVSSELPLRSPKGKRLLAVTYGGPSGYSSSQLVLVTVDTGKLRPLRLVSPYSGIHATWSPDGNRIAYASDYHYEEGRYVPPSIRELNLLTGKDRTLGGMVGPTRKAGKDPTFDCPSWSPDGRTIAFLSMQDSNEARFLDVGTGKVRAVFKRKEIHKPLSWSPDGRTLACWEIDYADSQTRLLFLSLPPKGPVIAQVRFKF